MRPPHTPEPDDVPSIAERQAAKWLEIQAKRTVIKSGGVLVDGYWYHSDDTSRIQFLGLAMDGDAVAATPWKTMSGEFKLLSPDIVKGVVSAVKLLDIAAHTRAEIHKASMQQTVEPENYDFSAGWPEIYQL